MRSRAVSLPGLVLLADALLAAAELGFAAAASELLEIFLDSQSSSDRPATAPRHEGR